MIVYGDFAAQLMSTGMASPAVAPSPIAARAMQASRGAATVVVPFPTITPIRMAAPVVPQLPPSASADQTAAIRGLINEQQRLAAAMGELTNFVKSLAGSIAEGEKLTRTLAANVEQNLAVIDQAIRDQGDALSQVAGAISGTFTPRRAAGPANRWTAQSAATQGNSKGTIDPAALVTQSGAPEVEAEFAEFEE